ncbi:MAG TPA: apolipoprotein N-acyltransferase [Caulobacteraceae bacterium]
MAEPPKPARSPWIVRIAALAAGLAAGLAQPPFGLLPGLLGYAALMVLLDEAPGPRQAFGRGWLVGVGYFLVSLWWLFEPFQVDAAHQGWMAPFAVALVTAGMALFWGAAGAAYRWLASPGWVRLLLLAGVLSAFEWLRGHLLTGFPWDLPGETWVAGGAVSQFASVVGAYGLTWITLGVAAAPALLWRDRRAWPAVAVAAAVLIGLFGFGAWRLAHAPAESPNAPRLRLVQANVNQASKYDPALFQSIVRRYVALTARPSAVPASIVIWPEGAIPDALEDYLAPGTWTEQAIAGSLQPGQTLILGGYRTSKGGYFNSLAALRRSGTGFELLGVYDKFRLVPFGEYIPLDSLAGRLGIKTMVHVGDGFAAGPRPRPLALPGLPPFQPLICYEALYPGFTREGARAAGFRAAWIVNISNDAWFGATSGPLQHLNIASYRAIEEGLPMVRATPTGVSAVIDAFGRVRASLPEGGFGDLDAPLPAAIAPTPFTRFGGAAFAVMLLASLIGARFGRPWRD